MPMYDTTALLKAGIPLSSQMIKYGNAIDQDGNTVTPDLRRLNLNYDSLFNIMRQQNMIETIERYMWVNVPFGLTPDLIERLLFFRGKGVLYFNDKVDKFQFLPFALNGVIDEYGRFTMCNTLPFTGVDSEAGDNRKKKNKTTQTLVYQELPLVYDLPFAKEHFDYIKNRKSVGIILNDSTLAISQQPVIRSNYVTPVLRLLANIIQIINTAIYGVADHSILQVENQSEFESIQMQINAINQDILKGHRFTPVVGKLPITPLKTGNTADLEGLFNTFNSVQNLLKTITGVANAGVFDKKAHLLQSEHNLNGSNADDIYYNGLRARQEFCLMIQAYYNYPIWCESKRGMTEAQAERVMSGETNDADNTQIRNDTGGNNNADAGA